MEMILALAMLMFGLAVVYQLLNVSRSASTGAEEMAIVQLACQTKMNELLAMNNASIPSSGFAESIANVKDWEMRIERRPTDRTGVAAIHVLAVKRSRESGGSGHRFELVRWKLEEPAALKN